MSSIGGLRSVTVTIAGEYVHDVATTRRATDVRLYVRAVTGVTAHGRMRG
jgi:hypothetical protein